MADLKTLARRLYDEVLNEQKVDLIDEFMADDFVEHEELPPGVPAGREGPRAMFTMLFSAFPDFRADVKDILQDGNKVVVRARFSGTHEGEFMGMPPTGNTFDIAVIDIAEYANGKMAAHWGVMDTAAMMQQLGVGGHAE